MGHERNIEAMRDARHGLPSPSSVQRRRQRRRRLWTRRIAAFVGLLVVAAVVAVAAFVALRGNGSGGGDFVGTWKKGNGNVLTIKKVDDVYRITFSAFGTGATGPSASPSPQSSLHLTTLPPTKATLEDGVLTAKNAGGVRGLTITFTLADGGTTLVETFGPNGSQDHLTRQ